jgi:hypothetical protein
MTCSTTATATAPTRRTPTFRLVFLIRGIKAHITRFCQPDALDQMSDHLPRGSGLIRSDADWRRSQRSAQDAATMLAIRAGVRAGNW